MDTTPPPLYNSKASATAWFPWRIQTILRLRHSQHRLWRVFLSLNYRPVKFTQLWMNRVTTLLAILTHRSMYFNAAGYGHIHVFKLLLVLLSMLISFFFSHSFSLLSTCNLFLWVFVLIWFATYFHNYCWQNKGMLLKLNYIFSTSQMKCTALEPGWIIIHKTKGFNSMLHRQKLVAARWKETNTAQKCALEKQNN